MYNSIHKFQNKTVDLVWKALNTNLQTDFGITSRLGLALTFDFGMTSQKFTFSFNVATENTSCLRH